MFKFVILWCLLASSLASAAFVGSFKQYNATRNRFLERAFRQSLGSNLLLSPLEEKANSILMASKNAEINAGFVNPAAFAPALHIFDALELIQSSKVFQMLQKMPKGGVLHSHDTALASTAAVMNLTYTPGLWILGDVNGSPQLIFSDVQPPSVNGVDWQLVADVRQSDSTFDADLAKHLSLYTPDPLVKYHTINDVWNSFGGIFGVVTPLLTYQPVWEQYFYDALTQFLADGVQYLEFRGTLPSVSMNEVTELFL